MEQKLIEQGLIWFLLVLAIPAIGAWVCWGLRGRLCDALATLFAMLTAMVGLYLIALWAFEGQKIELGGLAWISKAVGVDVNLFGFMLDPLSGIMLFVVVVIGLAVILYSTDYIGPGNKEHPLHDGKGRYFFWMLLFITSMVGIAISSNFFQLFIFWELTTLCSWALISYYDEDPEALRGGYKALIMTHIGGLFLMTAIVILFIATHSFDFEALQQVSPALRSTLVVLLLVGAWAKAAQVPFYTWLPDAMVAPTPVSAYLHAAAMVKAGVYLTARTVIASQPFAMKQLPISHGVGILMAVMALVTMFIVVYLFFFQDDLKRLLALSTIAHLAYIMLGCALGVFGSEMGFQGGLIHIAAHGAGKGLLFLAVGALAYYSGSRRISELSGAMTKLPLVAVAFFIGVLTVTGVPPFAGFWSKLFLITGALQLGKFGAFIAICMVIESVVAFGWLLWIGQRVFFGTPSTAVQAIGSDSASIDIAMVIMMILCLAVSVVAIPFAQAATIVS